MRCCAILPGSGIAIKKVQPYITNAENSSLLFPNFFCIIVFNTDLGPLQNCKL